MLVTPIAMSKGFFETVASAVGFPPASGKRRMRRPPESATYAPVVSTRMRLNPFGPSLAGGRVDRASSVASPPFLETLFTRS